MDGRRSRGLDVCMCVDSGAEEFIENFPNINDKYFLYLIH